MKKKGKKRTKIYGKRMLKDLSRKMNARKGEKYLDLLEKRIKNVAQREREREREREYFAIQYQEMQFISSRKKM